MTGKARTPWDQEPHETPLEDMQRIHADDQLSAFINALTRDIVAEDAALGRALLRSIQSIRSTRRARRMRGRYRRGDETH
jgi:hypothetical protein